MSVIDHLKNFPEICRRTRIRNGPIMYNERLEQLIKAALADGVVTEKERQVLYKRAQEQGIDLD